MGWGAARRLALEYPNAVIGLHLRGTIPFVGALPDEMSNAERTFVANVQSWYQTQGAYALGTAPSRRRLPSSSTTCLLDSRRGSERSSRRGETTVVTSNSCDVNGHDGLDALPTHWAAHWETQPIGSSVRAYHEGARDLDARTLVSVPPDMLMAPKDLSPSPRAWMARVFNLDHWSETPLAVYYLE